MFFDNRIEMEKTEKKLYRYYADLRHGSFIFVTKDGVDWPPEGYPVVELPEDEVKQLILGDDDGISS